jgi:trichohyalin
LRADDCCIGRKESSSADTSEHASEKEGSKRPLEKAEAAAGARCGDLRALLHDGFAKRLLSQEGEPPSASTTDREALRDFERSEKAKRLCLEKEQDKRFLKKEEREKRQADLEWWTNLLALKQEEKKEEKEKLKEEQEKRRFLKKEEREKRQANLEWWTNLLALKQEEKKEEKEKLKEEQEKLKEEKAKQKAAAQKEAREEKAKQKADAQADAQAMASKVKATLWEPGVMHECIDSIASSPYDLQRGKVGCS